MSKPLHAMSDAEVQAFFDRYDEQPARRGGGLVVSVTPLKGEFRSRLPVLSKGPKALERRARRRRSVPTATLRLQLDELEVRMRASDREAAELEAR
jgi:hypothetical protein